MKRTYGIPLAMPLNICSSNWSSSTSCFFSHIGVCRANFQISFCLSPRSSLPYSIFPFLTQTSEAPPSWCPVVGPLELAVSGMGQPRHHLRGALKPPAANTSPHKLSTRVQTERKVRTVYSCRL